MFHRAEEPPVECNEDNLGSMFYSITENGLLVCDGEEWIVMSGSGGVPSGDNAENAIPNCAAAIQLLDDAADGVLDHTDGEGGKDPFKVYCDITNGGGTPVCESPWASRNTWAMSWVEVTEVGKQAHNPNPESNYLLPWNLSRFT